jgi:hypothetical protein
MHSQTYLLFQNEGYLLRGCIQSGLGALRRSSSAERGPLYAALFSYSIGLERLLKVSLILDHCVVNKGKFPTWKEIRGFGHDLVALHDSALAACKRHNVQIPESCMTDDIDERLIELLAGFADSGRYFNLDALTGGGNSADPLPEWGKLVAEIYKRDVPALTRLSDEEQIEAQADSKKPATVYIPATGFDGTVQSYEEFFANHGKITLAMPEVVWRFARMLYPFQMLVFELDQPLHSGKAGKPEDYPHLWEICAFCSKDKQATLAEISEF